MGLGVEVCEQGGGGVGQEPTTTEHPLSSAVLGTGDASSILCPVCVLLAVRCPSRKSENIGPALSSDRRAVLKSDGVLFAIKDKGSSDGSAISEVDELFHADPPISS